MDRASGELQHLAVEAPCGRLTGLRRGDILAFKGIPFAQPPVGALRWRAPEALPAWSGVRSATQFGPVCPQAPTQIEALLGGTLGEQSEDCLYLNVWTPGCDRAKRPVLLWIHGGAFVIGAGSQGIYNGSHLAARDCVVVTINYRLGVFGFLNLSDAIGAPGTGRGSEGIADQVLALDWVKQNIAAFGGDPENVTIFGESAGAMSVATLLSIPAVRGLFHKAIVQSGAAHIGYARDRSAKVAKAFLGELDATGVTLDGLRAMPSSILVKAQIALLADLRESHDTRKLGTVAFQPTIDGDLIREQPIEAVRSGAADGIPLLAGTTKEEWRLFSSASPRLRLMSRSAWEARVRKLAGEHAPAMLAAYSEGTTFDRFNAFMTDRVFAMPATCLLEAQGARAPVYAYRFDWCSRLLGGFMGSCHAQELGFVFGTYDTKLAGAFFGTGPQADALADAMMDCWIAFARTGNPSAASVAWPKYDSDTRRTMIFGDGKPHVVERPNEARRLAWDGISESRLGP